MLLTDQLAYGVDELADATRLGRRVLCKEIGAGRGPKLRQIGRRTIITKQDAEEWLRGLPIVTPAEIYSEDMREARP